jgi:1-acyl-sn-glycerol-3-phosphate acyltransferase
MPDPSNEPAAGSPARDNGQLDILDLSRPAGATDPRGPEDPDAGAAFDLPVAGAGTTGTAAPQELPRPEGEAAGAGDLLVEDRLTRAREREARVDAERQERLKEALARFAGAARRLAPPGFEVPDAAAAELLGLLRQLVGPWYPRLEAGLRQGIDNGYLSPDVLKGLYIVSAYLARGQAGAWRRRWEGDYQVDDFGLDREFLEAVMPLAQFLYGNYWRVEVTGLENLPADGRALLVSNHSGVLPFDGAMIATAIYHETDSQRIARALVASWFPTLPFLSVLLRKTGQVQANPYNALQLLERDELVVVFPEGYKGVSKLYRDRYKLARFGRGGFIRVAVRAGAPIIPVAVVGAEETYPVIGRSELLARLLRFPFFPITPTWPWLGPLGLVPLPSKWSIDVGPPIPVDAHGSRAAANPALVSRLTEQVRSTIQQMLLRRLARRRSVWFG